MNTIQPDTAILPCDCGGAAKVSVNSSCALIQCSICPARIYDEYLDTATELWNRRADTAQTAQELESLKRMFMAACADLGVISEALGLDPDDGGAEPILDAIEQLKASAQDSQPVGQTAIQEPVADQTFTKNIRSVTVKGDFAVEIVFASCRAAGAFKAAIDEAMREPQQ